jgi:hypothetical protein
LTPESLVVLGAALISLLATYVPKFNVWFAGQETEVKQLIMLGAMFALAVGAFSLGCVPGTGYVFLSCDVSGAIRLGELLILAAMINQGVDRITPEPSAVKAVKAAKMLTTGGKG